MDVPPADLAQCADEPIRVPGAIQPHGRMAVLQAGSHALLAWSANWGEVAQVRAALAELALDRVPAEPRSGPASIGVAAAAGQRWDVAAHHSGDSIVLEFEPAHAEHGLRAPIYTLARHFLPQLQAAGHVLELAQLAATEMKRLTGFGRCLVYRFDAQGHGEVLAEERDDGYDSYLGHRFPAADIPAQARALYLLNQIRLIPDANYTPVPLVGAASGWEPTSLDLSYATLRSVSPVHLEYMRNMGTLASMSVSIVVAGQLWGLISCHDHQPRRLGFAERVACEHLGRLLALQIEARESNAEVATRLELRKLTLEIVAHLADSDATLQRLVAEPAPLLGLADAAGAAVVLDEHCWSVGEVPAPQQVHALARWIAGLGRPVWHSDRLAEDFAPAAQWSGGPAGVLALSISQVHRHLILWFRPELVQTLQWAGDPRKLPQAADGRVHPRRSFASWREQVRGRSPAWSAGQLAAAAELRQALIGIVLRRAEEMAEVATELGRVNKELEAFSYTVSHDLRAPMRHIAGYVDLVLDTEGAQLGERSRRYLGHVKEASAFAGHLVDALLDFSRMGRSAIKRTEVDVQTLVEDLVHELQRQEAGRPIDWQLQGPLPALWADPFLLQVAVRNLLGNAVKYTRQREQPVIRIAAIRTAAGDGLEITDNGVGFQMKYVGKLFGVFQRLHASEEFEGTGIGLASVKRIVERHGGTVWARGEVGEGASFGFTLPRHAGGGLQANPSRGREDHA